jgi:hypothetical protein
MTIPFKTLKERRNADPAFRHASEEIGPEIEIAFRKTEARDQTLASSTSGTAPSVKVKRLPLRHPRA